jgi:hypothetical protein
MQSLIALLLVGAYVAFIVGRRHQRFVQSHADVVDSRDKLRTARKVRRVMARAALAGWTLLGVLALAGFLLSFW